ncbi:MAG: hypothetical protein EFT35_04795 [Methanophagales archaeon ANME-1-THS]|nr:MAG: hypothetical protein EFT35_04795 [Methanophagales archaeon ANME-1-THS]
MAGGTRCRGKMIQVLSMKRVSGARVTRWRAMETKYASGKMTWEQIAEFQATEMDKWKRRSSEVTQYCNPFGKFATVIKGHYMLHGTNGENGTAHPFAGMTPEERAKVSHGCIRTSNTDIEWLKDTIPVGTQITIQK